MHREGFQSMGIESEIYGGSSDDYVPNHIMEKLAEEAEFEVVERKATDKSNYNQDEFLSVALPHSTEGMSENELIEKVKASMKKGNNDTQKYQLRQENGGVPNKIQIWKHNHGYSAFALNS